MKKIITLVLCICAMVVLMSSCGQDIKNNGYNEILEVFDQDTKADKIVHYGSIIPIDDGFVYSENINVSETEEYTMEYFIYSFLNNKSTSVGIIEDWIYEASYDSIYNNRHVYMLVLTDKNATTPEGTTTYLYDIDISDASMTSYLIGNEISPYSSMAIKGETLLISCPNTAGCYIYKYNISTQELSLAKEYSFDMGKNSGEVIRHIVADEENIYLLRLKMDGETNVELYLDICDDKLSPVHSINITEYISQFVIETEDPSLEMRQLVSNLEINSNYVYYENFSITRAIFSLSPPVLSGMETTDKEFEHLKSLLKSSPNIWKSLTIGSPGNKLTFYELLTNDLYLFDIETQELVKCHLNMGENDYGISKVMQWGDHIVVFLSPVGEKTEKERYSKVIFANISKLYEGVVLG